MSHCLGRCVQDALRFQMTNQHYASGTFASVHLAMDSSAYKQVACKTIITKSKEKSDMQKVMKEVKILRGLDHVNLILTMSQSLH